MRFQNDFQIEKGQMKKKKEKIIQLNLYKSFGFVSATVFVVFDVGVVVACNDNATLEAANEWLLFASDNINSPL